MADFSAQENVSCFGLGRVGRKREISNTLKSNSDDVMLARELNELSVQERERVYDDVHGVAAVQDETPSFVVDALEQLDRCIAALPYSKRKDLDRAFFLRPSLHKDTQWKLMFLRADDFAPYQAAERMARHFSLKLKLFGEEKLVKDIVMDDMEENEHDMKVLLSDGNIVLKDKDRAGRPIWFSDCSKADYAHTKSTMRSFWYLAMATLEDEAAQTKGVSCVLFCPGREFLSNLPSISQVTSILFQVGSVHSSLPCRLTSFHFGTDEPRMKFFVDGIQKSFGKPVRLRLRSHFGSAIEMRYSLLTFGIECKGLLPTQDGDDDMRQTIVDEFRQHRIEIERRNKEQRLKDEAKSGIIIYPTPTDVLLGRGRPYQEWVGNRKFGQLIDSQMDRFQSCVTQFEKTCVILDVVKMVHDSNGRFLKRTDVGWEVISDEVARKKAGTTFRTRTGLISRAHPPATESSSRAAKRMKYDPNSVTSS